MIHVAAQQFSGQALLDSSLTHALPWRNAPQFRGAALTPQQAQPVGGMAPALSEFFVWLLVIAGFALAGIALRNRSNSRLDDRKPSLARIPLDL